ncbi:hypothetical protein [Streptomyces naphthomycinicus]|uniref:hypothetical protein n=1 Tax=Streptomyces naphthomycinicus TaxID=2872625 RepID=UPI001CEC5B4A|nr:hypothetical protein [Streptomyces sp. TML10]
MDSYDGHPPQIDARQTAGLQVGSGGMQINFGVGSTAPADRARRHLYFKIGTSVGTKFNLVPPIAESHPSEALSELLAGLERVGIPRQKLDAIRARADDVATAPAGKQFVAAMFAFAAAVDDVTDALRERSAGDEFDWFILADLIARIFLIVRALWPEDPTMESETMRAGLYALAERLDVPASVRSKIQGFASMELPTATLDEFANAAIRLQELCYRLL